MLAMIYICRRRGRFVMMGKRAGTVAELGEWKSVMVWLLVSLFAVLLQNHS